jgi:hypothetical protein
MWLPRHDDANMNNQGLQLTSILTGFLVGSALGIFGVGIVYAVSIGIATSIIVFAILFRHYDNT